MDTQRKPKVGFVPCLTFVKQGVAKPKLERVKPTKVEMKEIVKELRLREAEFNSRPKDEQSTSDHHDEQMSEDDDADMENDVDNYYGLDNYDNDEPDEAGISFDTDALLLNSAPESEDEESEEEAEEFTVKPDDNILVTGQVNEDVCTLQVYVLNTEKQEFFLFNDTYLPSYPVAVEWLDFNPKDSGTRGHYAAVGYMEPEIQVWDLNVADCLEPAFSLGSKKRKGSLRHRDAVMDLSWNVNARNVLASGSADHTVILWDLNELKSVTRLECFEDKIQSLKWHPIEAQTLLTGSCDGVVKLFDCRTPGANKTWVFEGEVERVMWNKFDPMHFFASTEKGMVHHVDVRATKPIWNLNAHTSAVGGLALSSYCKDMLVTGSQDETAKVWDLKDNAPALVTEKKLNIGHIYAISSCPDSPYVFAAGGANPDNHLYVWDIREVEGVFERFNDRLNVVIPDNEMEVSVIQTTTSSTPIQHGESKNEEPTPSTSAAASSSSEQTSVKNRTKKRKNKTKP
ncbi:Periodic tryptophan protein 1 [Orchesella cincta]|uniref:Periodic tryptophan protein 1 n=1 Tax=Orchesella cincta TaxID=48709 RepID=A0A1D2M6K7_ORCCI|nr:Periodic tryptophan protein 1 [Orchesella cincta]